MWLWVKETLDQLQSPGEGRGFRIHSNICICTYVHIVDKSCLEIDQKKIYMMMLHICYFQ